MCAAAAECPTTASVFIALRRDESLAPKGIIKGPAGEIGELMIGMKSLLEQKVVMDDDTE